MSDLIEATGLKKGTISARLSRLGIKPLSYEAVYPSDTLDRILAVQRGRPRKPQAGEPAGDKE